MEAAVGPQLLGQLLGQLLLWGSGRRGTVCDLCWLLRGDAPGFRWGRSFWDSSWDGFRGSCLARAV